MLVRKLKKITKKLVLISENEALISVNWSLKQMIFLKISAIFSWKKKSIFQKYHQVILKFRLSVIYSERNLEVGVWCQSHTLLKFCIFY